jgi:hypothetical protein
MQWWLMVFILLGNSWLSADNLDGWRYWVHAAEAECEARREFTEAQMDRHGSELEARWICSIRQAVTKTPPINVEAEWENSAWPVEARLRTHQDEPHLEAFTMHKLAAMGPDGIALRYEGPVKAPLTEELRKLLLSSPQRFNHVVLELDSNGGDLAYVREVVGVLQEVRSRMHLTTRVMEGAICASGCIPVYMQGETRKASGASVWVFHGARTAQTNVPSKLATIDYLDMLSTAGLDSGFRAELERDNNIFRPGSLILSGYEVFSVMKAGVITELLPVWREEKPVFSPVIPSQ